jgi:hypothetical protein
LSKSEEVGIRYVASQSGFVEFSRKEGALSLVGETMITIVLDSKHCESHLDVDHISRPHFKTRLKIQMVPEVIFIINLVTTYNRRQDPSSQGGLVPQLSATGRMSNQDHGRTIDGFDRRTPEFD